MNSSVERFYDDNKATLEGWLRHRFDEALRQTFGSHDTKKPGTSG